MDIVWHGITRAESMSDWAVNVRNRLADAAKAYDWHRVIELVSRDGELINSWRPGGKSMFAPLHQAAHVGAPVDIVDRLCRLGAWRTLRNGRGERPIDVAVRRGHDILRGVLEPVLKHSVPSGALQEIEKRFHEVIHGRIDRHLPDHGLRLPQLEPLLELDRPAMWFPVPGMIGGFSYWLDVAGVIPKLVCESWSRAATGSGERHEITAEHSRLVEEGFV